MSDSDSETFPANNEKGHWHVVHFLDINRLAFPGISRLSDNVGKNDEFLWSWQKSRLLFSKMELDLGQEVICTSPAGQTAIVKA